MRSIFVLSTLGSPGFRDPRVARFSCPDDWSRPEGWRWNRCGGRNERERSFSPTAAVSSPIAERDFDQSAGFVFSRPQGTSQFPSPGGQRNVSGACQPSELLSTFEPLRNPVNPVVNQREGDRPPCFSPAPSRDFRLGRAGANGLSVGFHVVGVGWLQLIAIGLPIAGRLVILSSCILVGVGPLYTYTYTFNLHLHLHLQPTPSSPESDLTVFFARQIEQFPAPIWYNIGHGKDRNRHLHVRETPQGSFHLR